MNPSMISAATSMRGLQQKIDLVANNVSNVSTIGYKRQEASFFDVFTSVKQQEDEVQLEGRRTPPGITLDWGSTLSRVRLDLTQGSLLQTDQPLDLAIEGNALFEIAHVRQNANGEQELDAEGNPVLDRAWTRNGSFQLMTVPGDDDYLALSTKDGHYVRGIDDELLLVPKQHRIRIDADGNVWAYPERNAGTSDEAVDPNAESAGSAVPVHVGQLKIAQVMRPDMLDSIGGGWFRVTGDAGSIDDVLTIVNLNARTDETESIAIRQGFLEQSNVDLSKEMTELITLQRSLQFNSRALSSADQMMAITNNLRG